MILIQESSEAHIVRYNTGHVAVAERLADAWRVRVFKNTFSCGKAIAPQDGSTLTFCVDNPQEAANEAMRVLGLGV